ncbi:Brix-domain-containing protein [Lindgomyces ingoldianus]|uniref:Brix-domain-containing protein n=1 Tax=Lindgomyces ingoldianus TaxID=673940 RepID=A0ACB6QA57_9PLEO|nr:Brix-domain-containing protein [Lindgomyces ingoldianus]KAF2463025.1 Brix-domain-containing protein [Lindgomyces ingoldianus]
MLRQAKPKNARAKRALDKRAPQEHENPKMTLFVPGNKTTNISKLAVKDLAVLKKPLCMKFTQKNEIHPFEDPSSLEFFANKNDTSILVLSLHSKKRPHCLTFVRTFDYRILDMLELYIVPETFREMQQFKNKKAAEGLKPMIAFHGAVFENPNETKYTLAKSLLLDFFRGQEATGVDVEGLQYLISVSAEEEDASRPAPQIHIRVYRILTKRSGQKLPRIEVEETGPRIDFRLGRERFAEPNMMKDALRKPKGTEPKTKKNIDTDIMGDKVGKIHVGKQDFSALQTRKMKGLKRGRGASDDEEGTVVDDLQGHPSVEEPPTPKKGRY